MFFPKWLANTVVVKKKNDKWRVCVDFTNLNQSCPKDPFLVPKINQLVDATVGHQRMIFLDAFQGYYQRIVTRMFKDLIDKIVEVYINDMVVKTKESKRHTCDLVEVFDVLRQHKLRLNAE